MSRVEFAARQHEAARTGSWMDVCGLTSLVVGALGFLPAVRHLCTCYPPYRVVCGAALCAALFGGIQYCLAQWTLRRRARRHGLLCPDCGASLLGGRGARVAVTGRCRYCGAVLLTAAEPAVA